MDSVCKAALRELDEAKRNELLKQGARIFSRDLPACPCTSVAKVGLMNCAFSGLVYPREPWNVHRWYWQ